MTSINQIKYKCFDCEGAKSYWLNHDDQAPTLEPCDICKGQGALIYDEAHLHEIFPGHKERKEIDAQM